MTSSRSKSTGSVAVNLLDETLKLRDWQREEVRNAKMVISRDEVPVENNRMGLYRWYLHPSMKNIAIRTLLIWEQEIPPGSRSGKQYSQGGQVHIVLEGRGYTIIDGVRYDWEQNDAIFLPLVPEGTTHQHFNADPKNRARLLGAEPNTFDELGVDKGSGFEILEDSPDYRP